MYNQHSPCFSSSKIKKRKIGFVVLKVPVRNCEKKFQSWNDVFQDNPRLQGVCQIYNELKAKGVQFPVTDPGSMAPILTPKKVGIL